MTYSPQEISEFLKKIKEYNPLHAFFYSLMAFYAWKNYTDLVFEKLIHLNLKNNSPSTQEQENLSQYSEENLVSDSESSSEEDEESDDDKKGYEAKCKETNPSPK